MDADGHTSDIGHWFAMTKTDFVDSLSRALPGTALYMFGLPYFDVSVWASPIT